jgi:Ran GTPase-activating protein (RanGAP) involved in mRNA processing and transport
VHFQTLLTRNNTLHELNLAWNQIRRDGAYAVALGLKGNHGLKKLDVRLGLVYSFSQRYL